MFEFGSDETLKNDEVWFYELMKPVAWVTLEYALYLQFAFWDNLDFSFDKPVSLSFLSDLRICIVIIICIHEGF